MRCMSWQEERYIQQCLSLQRLVQRCMSWQKERYIQQRPHRAVKQNAACHGKKKGTSNLYEFLNNGMPAACHGKKKGTSNPSEAITPRRLAACHGKKKGTSN